MTVAQPTGATPSGIGGGVPALSGAAGGGRPAGQRVGLVNIANALTVTRLLLVPVFLVALFAHGGHSTGWRFAAWAVFALASFTDRFDGELARRRQLVTEFGKLADPIADKALTTAALIGLSLLAEVWWWVTAVVLLREWGVTLVRLAVLRHGVIPASRGGKLKTLLLGVGIGLFILPLPHAGWVAAAVVFGIGVAVALVTGVDYVGRAVVLRRRSRRAHAG